MTTQTTSQPKTPKPVFTKKERAETRARYVAMTDRYLSEIRVKFATDLDNAQRAIRYGYARLSDRTTLRRNPAYLELIDEVFAERAAAGVVVNPQPTREQLARAVATIAGINEAVLVLSNHAYVVGKTVKELAQAEEACRSKGGHAPAYFEYSIQHHVGETHKKIAELRAQLKVNQQIVDDAAAYGTKD